jgi:hypothetical protein
MLPKNPSIIGWEKYYEPENTRISKTMPLTQPGGCHELSQIVCLPQ